MPHSQRLEPTRSLGARICPLSESWRRSLPAVTGRNGLPVRRYSSMPVRTTGGNEVPPMGANESVASHLLRLLPNADAGSVRRLEGAARQQAFCRRDVLHARGIQVPPFVVLDGHVMYRRVVETGQVRAALIAGPGYLGGLRSISDPAADAFYELVALTDGRWATWDPRLIRQLALRDAGLAVGFLDLSAEFAMVINVRLDAQSFASARQRMAAILTRYGDGDLRYAPSGCPASRPGSHDRDEPRDDVPDVEQSRGRRPRKAPPRRRDQHRGLRGVGRPHRGGGSGGRSGDVTQSI